MAMAYLGSVHLPWRVCVFVSQHYIHNSVTATDFIHTLVVYSPSAGANKGACTTNITGMQRVSKAFKYSDHGQHWWHQPAWWHHAVISTSAHACWNSWSYPWPSEQGGLHSSRVHHAGDGWGQSWFLYLLKLWIDVISAYSSSGSKFHY